MSYTESILTEDYANKFNECLLPGASKLRLPLTSYKSDLDQDSVFTEDVETKIRNQRDPFKYSNPNINLTSFELLQDNQIKPLEFDDKDAFNVERKYQEILKKRRNRASNYIHPYQPPVSQYQDNYRNNDEQSSVFEDYSMEIRHKKNEIQMDLERERRRNRSTSPELIRNNFVKQLSPRETLERKVVELDQLSSSVQKATLEHQQLCKELQVMQNQLRKNQAEVRLSERMAMDNKEKIDFIHKELRNAENRRDQTMKHLEIVNEELALKRAKLKSFDLKMIREMANIRKMDQLGIDKEEIEKILAERDELYQIVKRQEDIQLEKYQLAKQLDIMRDDLFSEQEKASKQIENLEDELECSLIKIKQLQFEKDELEAQLEHLRQHLNRAEDQACKSTREVSELRDEYQIRIRKKLDEYEMDKERVEKELKKLEDEKTNDETNLKNHIDKLKKESTIVEKERKELRELVSELEEQMRKSVQTRRQILEDQEFKIRQLQKEYEENLQKQKKESINEQKLLLEEKDIQYGHEKNKIQKQCNEEIDMMMRDLQLKEKEISELYERQREIESDCNYQLKQEELKFENILQKEKVNWAETSNKKKQNEIHKIRADYEATNKSVNNHIEQLTATLKERDNELSGLKQEICNVRMENQKTVSESIIATRKMKDNVKQDTIKELKTRYEEKMDKELLKIKSDYEKKLNFKMSAILKEKAAIEDSEKKSKHLLCKVVKTVIHEINGECCRMALLLNVHPRKVDHSKISSDFSKSDNVITHAIANLEACGSEIRNLLEELESKVKSLTEKLSDEEMKFENEVRNIRYELEGEKNKDVTEIRENLLKEHLREINRLAKSPDIGLENLLREKEKEISKLLANRQVWKERAAEKIAEKFSQHNQKKNNELRNMLLKKESEIRQLKAVRGRSSSPVLRELRASSALALEKRNPNFFSLPSNVISSLKENLENLRKENIDLRQKISGFESYDKKSKIERELRSNSRSRER